MPKHKYPLTIMKSRYQGTYEGGAYIAFNLDPEEIPHEVKDDDITCASFFRWADKTSNPVIGRGRTADEAEEDLWTRIDERCERGEHDYRKVDGFGARAKNDVEAQEHYWCPHCYGRWHEVG